MGSYLALFSFPLIVCHLLQIVKEDPSMWVVFITCSHYLKLVFQIEGNGFRIGIYSDEPATKFHIIQT